MALTTIKRPIGRRFAAVAKTATVDNDFNYARFTSTAHGLTTGDFILIQNSPVPAYNGIWYADVNSSSEYFIRPSATADYVSWVADASVQVRGEDLEHMWSAVHLPIVYEVTTSLYPFSTTTPLGIVSIDNNNGFARLRLTGDFSASSDVLYPLEFIRITNATDSRLNSIWQIQDITYSGGQAYVTIDLAYRGDYVQTSSQVRRYYSNYALIVRVYAGITGAPGATKKPMELAATLKFIPDSNNTVKFSISEILQSYVKMRNAVGDDTMPNNIDFFTEFYVTYQETYDYSFGYTLLRSEGSITTDTPDYIGKAVNSKLIFGNPYSGYLSDYIMNTSTAKFLTLFAIPVLFACQDSETPCYQDISFINPSGGGALQKKFYKNGIVQTTVSEEIPDKGPGVYRMPLNTTGVNMCLYDEVGVQLIESATIPTFDGPPEYGTVKNIGGNHWGGVADHIFSNSEAGDDAPFGNIMYYPCVMPKGTYTLSFNVRRVNASGSFSEGGPSRFYLVGLDASTNVVEEQEFQDFTGADLTSGNKSKTGSFQFVVDEDVEYLGLWYHMDFPSPTSIIAHEVYSLTITDFVPDGISEEKRFRIDCGCSAQELKLTWVNNLGGFDYWTFKAEKDYITEVVNTQESEKNVLPQWPQSYGHTSDTIRYETMRISRRQYIIRSQNGLTVDEAFALSYIGSSPLVQLIDKDGRRTVIVGNGSFRIMSDGEKLLEIEFTITETADIPAQKA